ncbi:hypothetical protein RHGRI_024400 [Rhododendron griersonianum]|uniref:Uncharacterized protein n=1 Tax=Rhododendron griersonianum TaxID=479676 RepID=A0AAV6JCK7_9ERIC|nr:hypothetical protein RHGRI_024400 [Rhododendron griersonianum]
MISGGVGLTALRMYLKKHGLIWARVSRVDKEVVEKVSCIYHCLWDIIAPGLASQFDSLYTIPIIAPRPLLILNEMSFSAL